MAKIKMLKTLAGSMNGINHKKYTIDEEYEIDGFQINQRLADIFLKGNLAKIVDEVEILQPSERTVIKKAPETKVEELVEDSTDDTIEDILDSNEDKEETTDDSNQKVMRVYNLANELKTPVKKIINIAKKLKINANAAQSGLTQYQVDKIKAEFNK